jgi:diguanylate cyclase (GGDEF)-like protein
MQFSELAVWVGILIGLVIVRQIVAVAENNQLYARLIKVMSQIRQQTNVLEATNSELQVEIGERRRAEERLTYDALHDGLTLLPNRTLFLDRLERGMEYCKRRPDYPFAVLFLDIDQFKVINDSLGHTIGDQLLVSIALRLSSSIRSGDTVARLGGDEFVVLLENIPNENTAAYVAGCILEDLKKPFRLEGQDIFVSASIGIVKSVHDYQKPDDVLRDADIAMYRAKGLGKARFEFFHDGLRTEALSRLELENDLRHAIENQEFDLFYQPIFRLADSEMTSCEALVRWRHPRRGLLLPGDFILVAEESGLILAIGRWVLLEACSQLKRWHETHPRLQNLAINVNISGKQFTRPDFVDQVKHCLSQTGLQAKFLKLEITETVLIDNYAAANDKFQELQNIGVQLQIDDFGTGYSSLGYLQQFPVHTIKIDKSFVQEMGKGKKGSDLIRAMVSMARDLGMDTIAEGIETEDQLDELKGLTCPYGQGYLLARPAERFAFEKILEEPAPIEILADSSN